MVGNFMFPLPVAEVDLITKIDFMQQSQIYNVQPEQELNEGQMPIDTTSSPTSAKPNVGCSASKSEIKQRRKNIKLSQKILSNKDLEKMKYRYQVVLPSLMKAGYL